MITKPLDVKCMITKPLDVKCMITKPLDVKAFYAFIGKCYHQHNQTP